MKTRDSYNQEHTHYINGHKITLERDPKRDSSLHANYVFKLTTKDGQELFGHKYDLIGIPKTYGSKRLSNEATLAAFACATMQENDTDSSFFDSYTAAELAWCRSFACEQLGYEVSDLEERISRN